MEAVEIRSVMPGHHQLTDVHLLAPAAVRRMCAGMLRPALLLALLVAPAVWLPGAAVSPGAEPRPLRYHDPVVLPVAQLHHLLPVPAVYVVDPSGRILFAYWNADYRQRLDADKVVDAARAAASRGD